MIAQRNQRGGGSLAVAAPVLILFDHGTPKGLIRELPGHTVHTAQANGWDTLGNGALLKAAEEAGYEVLVTTDRRIRYQQNLRARRIALVVLTGTTRWSLLREHTDRIAGAVASGSVWMALDGSAAAQHPGPISPSPGVLTSS